MNRTTKSILIIDQEIKQHETLAVILRRKGFQVIFSMDGPEAYRLFSENNIALGIIGLDLANIDGPKLLDKAKVDVWDALTSVRPYRDVWSKKNSGLYKKTKRKHFEPAIGEFL
jgi:response regulator RpfG family c-di-GMP phosphodiesterase